MSKLDIAIILQLIFIEQYFLILELCSFTQYIARLRFYCTGPALGYILATTCALIRIVHLNGKLLGTLYVERHNTAVVMDNKHLFRVYIYHDHCNRGLN